MSRVPTRFGDWLPRKRSGQRSSSRFARTGFAESTLAELAWQRTRHAAGRWAGAGALVGLLLGLVLFAPAAWLSGSLASATEGRLLLTETRGTVWSGSGVAVLTAGAESRDARALPGRVNWRLRPAGLGFELRATQPCCLNKELVLQLRPGLGRFTITLPRPADPAIGQWPAAWLAGLGTPWNTLQPGGVLRLSSPGLSLESVQGRSRFTGEATIDFTGASSRVSPIDPLGNYRVSIRGDAAHGDAATLDLSTQGGALLLSGRGEWTISGVRFRGEARAAEGNEAALDNLLNIIGRRQGARAVIAIG